jgi:hypothetical protein
MAEEKGERKTGTGANDTTAKAPETKGEAEGETTTDDRLIPGGRHGATAHVGMSAMDRDDVPSEAGPTGQTKYRDTPDTRE